MMRDWIDLPLSNFLCVLLKECTYSYREGSVLTESYLISSKKSITRIGYRIDGE
jgi:hypothetical protein